MPPSSSTADQHIELKRSPLRSPRRVMANNLRSASQSSLINEIRESLTMPMAPALVDEFSDREEMDDVVELDEVDTVSVTSANTAANSVRRQEKALNRQKNFMSSDASVHSTHSTRAFGSFFRKTKNMDDYDNNSVTSTKAKGWWNRSSGNTDKKKERFRTFKSFRIKKKSKRSGKSINDRLVADFFDVQSLASEPDFVGSSRLQNTTVHGSRSSHILETRSVSSSRSTRSSFFRGLFFRIKNINDEVEGFEDKPDLTGTGIDPCERDLVDDDEDITLGSGFDNRSLADSIEDDNSVDSKGSNPRSPIRSRSKLSIKAQGEQPDKEDGKPFLQRMVIRRTLKKEDTILRKAVSGLPSVSPGSSKPLSQELKSSPLPIQRGKSLMQGTMVHSSSKSLGASPSSVDHVLDIQVGAPQVYASGKKPRGPNECGLCRWNSDHSLGSTPVAPKRPRRRAGSIDDAEPIKSPTTASKDKIMNKKIPTTTQSMRNLSTPSETKAAFEVDDDDDSILSLLSTLLATWTSERDGVVNVIPTQSPKTAPLSITQCMPKSILKTSNEISGEQKEEPRDQSSVAFHTIEIREYERVVGDNPSCSRGPPISIGWSYTLAHQYSLEVYEERIRPPRRSKKEFHLAADKRTHLLVNEWDCCEEEIRKARREATYIQYCRAKTSFSGSRAAAQEAAFLRKATDPKTTDPKATDPKATDLTRHQVRSNRKVVAATTLSTETSPKPSLNKKVFVANTQPKETCPEPVTRKWEPRPVQVTVHEPVAHFVRPLSPSADSRHRPLLEV